VVRLASLAHHQRACPSVKELSKRVKRLDGEDNWDRGGIGEGSGKVRVTIPSRVLRNPVRTELEMTLGNPIVGMSLITKSCLRRSVQTLQ
jgi:hypothetical protein